jgi:DNA-binding MarR family transcriptional regulator
VRGVGGKANNRACSREYLDLTPSQSRNLAVGGLGPVERPILEHLSIHYRDNLTGIARAIGKDVRRVFDSLKRLLVRGFVEKERRGLYKITELGLKIVNMLRAKQPTNNKPGGKPGDSQGKGVDASPNGGCSGRVGYIGRFFDNVRGYVGDLYVRGGRCGLVSSLAGFDRLSYFEVAHLIRGFVMEGVVVIYTNDCDLDRFNDCVTRVEWRPPAGIVKGNPPASVLRLSRFEFVKAFKALAVVLKQLLLPCQLSDLYRWLGGVWGLKPLQKC